MRRSRRGLSKRQRDVLEAIERLTARQGYPPTIRELADELGLQSTSSVHYHVDVLEEHQLLERRRPPSHTPGYAGPKCSYLPAAVQPLSRSRAARQREVCIKASTCLML